MYRKTSNILLFLTINLITTTTSLAVTDEEYASVPDVFHLDNYDKCLLNQQNIYCMVTFRIQPKNGGDNTSKVWSTIEHLNWAPSNYRHDLLRYGVCITEINATINVSDHIISNCNQKLENFQLQVLEIINWNCQNQTSPYTIDTYDYSFGAVILIYLSFITLASLYDTVTTTKFSANYELITQSKASEIIKAFSVPRNWHRLKSLKISNSDVKDLRVIQGVRFYNMLCVILSHTVMVNFAIPISNTLYPERATQRALNMFLSNGGHIVQTFLLISGWLMTYQFYVLLEGRNLKLVHLFLATINRLMRLMPTLAIMVAFHSTWLVHLGRGPFWDNLVGKEYRNCRSNWWTNLLFLNNYIDNKNMCLQQSWYLATDTQLFLVSLIIIYLMFNYPKKANYILAAAITVGLIIPFTICYLNNYDILVRSYPENLYEILLQVEHWHVMYSAGYQNITGYVIGIAFGYIFYRTRNTKIKITKIKLFLWWLFTLGPSIFIVLIAARMYLPGYKQHRFESALYWAFGRNIFALSIGIGIYGSTKKFGGIIRKICKWNPAVILGRLTFSVYLVHVAFIKFNRGLMRSPLYISDLTLFSAALQDVFISYLAGTVLCLFVEMPLSAIQKILFTITPPSKT